MGTTTMDEWWGSRILIASLIAAVISGILYTISARGIFLGTSIGIAVLSIVCSRGVLEGGRRIYVVCNVACILSVLWVHLVLGGQ